VPFKKEQKFYTNTESLKKILIHLKPLKEHLIRLTLFKSLFITTKRLVFWMILLTKILVLLNVFCQIKLIARSISKVALVGSLPY
jgi:hypothetical protein